MYTIYLLFSKENSNGGINYVKNVHKIYAPYMFLPIKKAFKNIPVLTSVSAAEISA